MLAGTRHMSTPPANIAQMDPIARAKHAAARIESARTVMAEARTDRRAALIEARAIMSVAEIAAALDISTARVYRVLSGKET